jgi:hypothetical protein
VAQPPIEFRIGDRLTLSRPHPCGDREWTVVRVGADIGIVCAGCGHRVLVERRRLESRLRGFVERGPA